MSLNNRNTERRLKLQKIKNSVHFPDDKSSSFPYLGKEVTECTTVLKPDWDHKVEKSVESILTERRAINWCRTMQTIHPLKITGQDSWFLSAISMALWNFCDAASFLHRLLFVSVSEFAKDVIFEHWIRNKHINETMTEIGFERFMDMTRCSSKVKEPSTEIDSNLYPHPMHIFIMSNLLRRPIMIIGDEDEECTGLYLPTLSKPEYCTKWPLILTMCNDSFLPLVNKELLVAETKLSESAIPLVSSELCPVKVKFLLGTEENEAFALLQNYICTTEHTFKTSSDNELSLILSAKLNNQPFEVDVGPPGEQFSMKQTPPIPNVMPPVPSASNIALNKLSEASSCIEENEEMSMLQETCRFLGCNSFVSTFTEPYCLDHVGRDNNSEYHNGPERNLEFAEISLVNERCNEAQCPHFASRFTYPYCYEHMGRKSAECSVRTKQKWNQLPPDSSVLMESCQHNKCKNYASRNVYPFCYEHLDDHSVHRGGSTCGMPKTNEPTFGKDFDISIMAQSCAHPNCSNHASKNVFPVCYEHLDSPLATASRSAAKGVEQLPYTGQLVSSFNESQLLGAPRQVPDVEDIGKKFREIMRELEATARNSSFCLKSDCTNFGNSKCRGYCHSCYYNSLK